MATGAHARTMIDRLEWLGLAAPDPGTLRSYYVERCGLAPIERHDVDPTPAAAVRAGGTAILLRPPGAIPAGGVHTHYAIAVSPGRYDDLLSALGSDHDVEERTFDGARSMYVTDPAGHCVEFGERGGVDGIGDVFEVVLEVRSLEPAVRRFRSVGFEVVDRGVDRPRARLRGPFDLEVWEPHIGIAGGRGGVHVELGLRCTRPAAVADRLGSADRPGGERDDTVHARDDDGHWFALRPTVGD